MSYIETPQLKDHSIELISIPKFFAFGIVFNQITMECLGRIFRMQNKNPIFLSTANLNFVTLASKKTEFRDAQLLSDITTIDGAPISLLFKTMGLKGFHRLPGATIFEEITRRDTHNDEALSIFFFGGEEDAAEKACTAINNAPSGKVRGVGALNPGFGSIESMSTAEIFAQINRHPHNFLIVSLGAMKGQQWIAKNLSKFCCGVVSHLGAVVNFASGRIERAPKWMQKFGLEWMWRIITEPKLTTRYAEDLITLFRLVICNVPFIAFNEWRCRKRINPKATIRRSEKAHEPVYEVTGDISYKTLYSSSRYLLAEPILSAMNGERVTIHFDMITAMDGFALGEIVSIKKKFPTVNIIFGEGASHLFESLSKWYGTT